MHPDRVSVLFTDKGDGINAHVFGPFTPDTPGDSSNRRRYADITLPLEQRGLDCTVDFGLDDYIVNAELPDGSHLTTSPERSDYPDDTPPGWLVTRANPDDPDLFEIVYDSQAGGPQQFNAGSVPHLLAGIDARLDQLGVATREQAAAVQQRAESLLHRAGFVPVVRIHESHHRLPAAMTDPGERQEALGRALDLLRSEGYGYAFPADLLPAPPRPAVTTLTDQLSSALAQTGQTIEQAGHTQEVVEALSGLTAPGDGILDRVIGVLDQTASWWEGLGGAADPHYAARLRYIAEQADGYVQEIRAMRGDLADRHAPHPGRLRPTPQPARAEAANHARVAAALATSPASTRTLTGHPVEAAIAAAATPVRTTTPRR
ncbi:hypothetical protein OG535_29180 [Kitasatospora sp. NBC_00085]|uniref:hypothetical protein n=1 Tax=Kitasatospora sp. NBC_00085 TaxID=2903566 RepID=UPI003255C30E